MVQFSKITQKKMLNLEDINSLDYDAFVDHFSNIVEYCPFIAGTMWKLQPFKSVDHFVLEAMKTIYSLPIPSKCNHLQGLLQGYSSRRARAFPYILIN